MRAAIYGRVSTDKQNDDSPDDQIDRCREYAVRQGYDVVESLVKQDVGISGAAMINRPGMMELMQRIDEWDVLLAWDWARISRSDADMGWFREQLEFRDLQAIEVSTGLEAQNLGSKVVGLMNSEHLRKLKRDTHRGLQGRFDRGLSAGAKPYGYRTEAVDPKDQKAGRRLVVDEDQAAVVRRIFEMYVGGEGLHAIAAILNREGVPALCRRKLGSGQWAASAIREMLRNETYHGTAVWNRTERRKHKGRTVRLKRPESEWKRHTAESWRIIPEDLWQTTQRTLRDRARASGADHSNGKLTEGNRAAVGGKRRSKRVLSGFLVCADCGGSFYACSRTRFACGQRRDRPDSRCQNDVQPLERELEERIFGAIEEQVLNPDHVAYVIEQAQAEAEQDQGQGAEQAAVRVTAISKQIDRLVKLAERAGDIEEIGARIDALAAEREALLDSTPSGPAPSFGFSELRAAIEARVAGLRPTLRAGGEAAREVLQVLFGTQRIQVAACPDRSFSLSGTALLSLDSVCTDTVVPGTGLEPARPKDGGS